MVEIIIIKKDRENDKQMHSGPAMDINNGVKFSRNKRKKFYVIFEQILVKNVKRIISKTWVYERTNH